MKLKDEFIIEPSGEEIIKSSRGAYVPKNEAYALAQTVEELFASNGIVYEVQSATYKERTPDVSSKIGLTGIELRMKLTWKTSTVTKYVPKGGRFES